ncbi:MAG: hypothetical protein ACLP7P_00220 [Rhodomicrobium sp.]
MGCQSERMKHVFGRWWRKYIVDECPDARQERLRWELIDGLKQNIDLREAVRLWELENRKSPASQPDAVFPLFLSFSTPNIARP